MTNLTTFNYLSSTVRVIEIDDHLWFVAADVCAALEMDLWAGTSRWLAGLASDEKRLVRRKELPQIFCGSKNAPSMNIISEPGLYKLIQSSTKPGAKKFDRWVRHEVLPAIRKDGPYIKGEELVKTGELDEEEFVRAMEILQRKVCVRLDAQNRAASATLQMA